MTLKGADGTTDRVNRDDVAAAGSDKTLSGLGLEVETLDEGTARRLRLDGGVRVTRVGRGRVASQTDMAPGFVITKVGNRDIDSVQDLESAIAKADGIVVIRGRYETVPGEKIYAFDPS